MVQLKALAKFKIDDLWREVKCDQEGRWGDIKLETMQAGKG